MKQKRILLLASMAMLMFGCKAQTSANEQAAPATAPVTMEAPAVEKLSPRQLLESKLKKDMPYAELRKIVLADGWLPLRTAACKENVGGEADICDRQPEVESCSGDGHCNMWFVDAAVTNKLRVGTYDEAIKFFEFSAMTEAPKIISCPSQDFKKFLEEFSSSKATQISFTSQFIKVMDMIDLDGKGYVERQIYVAKHEYKDFDLRYINNSFHVVDSDDKADETATPLEIKSEGTDSYFVKYFYGMSEGNSYRFQKKNDCWYLTEDPEAPAP